MSETVIHIDNISKLYRIGRNEERLGFGGWSLSDFIKTPLRKFRELRRLTRFSSKEVDDDVLWALKNISLDINEGDVFGVVGRNGAGKSTLLKILSRVTEPSFGRVEIKGRVGSLLEVGTGFHPELTGRENIYLNGTILGMKHSEIRQKFDEIVEFSEVGRFLDTPVKRYSSGMYVRLAFAVAVHLDPEILLLDEVLAVGDMNFQTKCFKTIKNTTSKKKTILFVSHNIGIIRKLCTKGVYLEAGQIKKIGKIDDVCNSYINDSAIKQKSYSNSDIVMNIFVKDQAGSEIEDWKYMQNLVVEVEVISINELRSAAIDLVFYTNEGVKVVAVQSDRIINLKDNRLNKFKMCFNIKNTGLSVSELYMDAGLRCNRFPNYQVLKQNAKIIPVSSAMLPDYSRSDSICCLPVECYLER